MKFEVQPIETEQALEELRGKWSALWDGCPGATPFQSPEWLLAWWNVFHPGRVASLAISNGGRLVGLAPLYIADDGILRFIGTGITDCLDVLLEPEFADLGARAIIEYLESGERFAECDLMELRAGSPLLGVRPADGSTAVCPVLRLPARPGYSHRRNLRRYGRRLEQAGDVRYEAGAMAHRSEYLDALFSLHAARWQARHEPGVLAEPRVRAFHEQAAAGFAARGWLRLLGLRFDGALAAVIYAFAARHRAYFYLSGFSPEIAEFSPGALLLGFALDTLTRAGETEAEFLRGGEQYKYLWGATDRTNYRLRIRSRSAASVRQTATGTPGARD